MKCVILAIGEELLEGSVVDTNSSFIAQALSEAGFEPDVIKALPDEVERLVSEFRHFMELYPLVITTGGLGPTFDDLTMAAVAKACDTTVELNETALRHIEEQYQKLGLSLREEHRRQAFLPATALLLPNDRGTALGTIVCYNSSMIISFPGVPHEMRPMLLESVVPYIQEYFEVEAPLYREDLHFANLPESNIDSVICEAGIPKGLRCIINASVGETVVRVRGDAKVPAFTERLKNAYPEHYIYSGPESPARYLVRLLQERKLTVSAAESCTGGLLSGAITAVSGSSEVFPGAVVSYANEVKEAVLGVPRAVLDTHGAVSEACALAMAAGVKKLMKTDAALSITGIAGPGGGTDEKPVGTVYISCIFGEERLCRLFRFSGERDIVRERSVKIAIFMLIKMLNSAQ